MDQTTKLVVVQEYYDEAKCQFLYNISTPEEEETAGHVLISYDAYIQLHSAVQTLDAKLRKTSDLVADIIEVQSGRIDIQSKRIDTLKERIDRLEAQVNKSTTRFN